MQRGEVALEEKRDGARVLLEVRERDEEDVMHDVPVAGSGHRHCFFFLFLFSVIAVGFVGTRILWNCSFFLLGNSWFVS